MTKNTPLTEASTLASNVKTLASTPLTVSTSLTKALPPTTTKAPIVMMNNNPAATNGTNDPLEVELYSDAGNASMQLKDEYFPVTVNLPGAPGTTTPDPNALTETEKRKRAILIASVLLLVLIVLVAIYSMKKRK